MTETRPDHHRTHRDLLPRDLCPSLMMKLILTEGLDSPVHDERDYPGDGYYWCIATCTQVGPDDEIVDVGRCRPGRPCYEGLQG